MIRFRQNRLICLTAKAAKLPSQPLAFEPYFPYNASHGPVAQGLERDDS